MAQATEVWRVNVTKAADADIEEIDRWTEQRFGSAQAQAYATAMADAINALAAGSDVRGARARTDIQSGLYTLHLARFRRRARHFVVFRIRDADHRMLDVLRVLHDAMDLPRHVPIEGDAKEAPR